MFSSFFRKPVGVGSSLNIYMFHPSRIWHVLKLIFFEHKYFFARLQVIIYQFIHPDAPWLTQAAVSYLDLHIEKKMLGFEWGSGKSTQWFAKRLEKLVSIEDDPNWYDRVRHQVDALNVDYRFVPTDTERESYPNQILEFPDAYFDLIVVDGSCRNACIRAAFTKVKPRGMIVVDNADSEIDVSPLASLEKIMTDNGVWRTDIYIKNITVA
jgi:hypothetical protein